MRGHEAETAVPLAIGAGERWALDQVRRHGVPAFIGALTTAAIVASLVLVVILLLVLDGSSDTEDWVRAFVIGTLVPVVLAPPLVFVSARLVSHLDAASQLLQESAVSDPLTGVANRRGFFTALDAMDGTRDLAVGMIDVDDFKAINDRFGHSTGDTALCMVAAWLEELIGERGTVGRLGGDEFAYVAVIDPDRPSPARHDFRLGDAEFSASIGHARAQDGDLHAALLAADADLYRQKQTRPAPIHPIVRTDRR
jgi:GGDEF domain-containing protein